MNARSHLCWLLLAAGVPAQIVLNPASGSPLVAAATLGASTQTVSASVVPNFASVGLGQGAQLCFGDLSCQLLSDPAIAQVRVTHQLGMQVTTMQTASVRLESAIRLQLTSPGAVWVELRPSSVQQTSVATQLVIEVDVDDDGVFEYQNGTAPVWPLRVQLGSVARPVVFRVVTNLTTNGYSIFDITLDILPTSATVHRQELACDASGPWTEVWPRFDGGVQISVPFYPASGPTVLVLGLGVQPLLLPAAVTLPCVLLPAPDILMLMPPPVGIHSPSIDVPLPPAVRPVTFWAQGVRVGPLGLLTTDSFRIEAP